jgi:hypothetical protein
MGKCGGSRGKHSLFKRDKNKVICLFRYYQEANLPFPPEDLDTSAEELRVEIFLWESDGGRLKKTVVIESLKASFDRRKKPFMQNRVLLSASSRKRFFVGKVSTAIAWP